MTNHELFTSVIAQVRRGIAIEEKGRRTKRGGRRRGRERERERNDGKGGVNVDENNDDGGGDEAGGNGKGMTVDNGNRHWRRIAMSIATSAARGEGGCRTPDEWHARYRSLLLLHDDGEDDGDIGDFDGGIGRASTGVVPATAPAADFGEALRSLDEGECYRGRLRNALDALDESSSLTTTTTNGARDDDDDEVDGGGLSLSVRRAAGLARCAALLLLDNPDGVGGGACGESSVCRVGCDDDDRALIERALVRLRRSIPRHRPVAGTFASSSYGSKSVPLRDILLAVQSPLLCKLNRNGTLAGEGGSILGSFASSSSSDAGVAEFRRLLGLEFDANSGDDCARAGEKRKRDRTGEGFEEDGTTRTDDDVVLYHLLEAAHHARKGAVRAQHGAVIYVPSFGEEEDDDDREVTTTKKKTIVIGRGWNHDYLLDQSSNGRKNKIVLHSEVHAVADAICNYGEDECFEKLFPRATIMIVELVSDYAYDTCHPCPKCDPLLRAVGIPTVLHTTPHGRIEELDLRPANAALLTNDNVYIPLNAACRERNITCKRLQQKCELIISRGGGHR